MAKLVYGSSAIAKSGRSPKKTRLTAIAAAECAERGDRDPRVETAHQLFEDENRARDRRIEGRRQAGAGAGG